MNINLLRNKNLWTIDKTTFVNLKEQNTSNGVKTNLRNLINLALAKLILVTRSMKSRMFQ